jgi:hypothetical protein
MLSSTKLSHCRKGIMLIRDSGHRFVLGCDVPVMTMDKRGILFGDSSLSRGVVFEALTMHTILVVERCRDGLDG